MHGQHRNAGVQSVDVPLGHELCHGAAAAGVGLAQFRHLPDNAVVVEQLADITHHFGGGVGCAALAAGAGVLAQAHAVVEIGAVAALVDLGKVGIIGSGHVGGQAEGMGEAGPQIGALGLAHVFHEPVEGLGLHAGHTLGADFFLVGEDTHGGALRDIQIEQGSQLGVGADAVIMAVGADEAAVKAQLPGLGGGDGFQLGGDEVLLGDAVLLVENVQNGQLHPVGALVVLQGTAADENVQALGSNGLIEGLFALLPAQVGQQVIDDELGILFLVADGHADGAAVGPDHHAVELQRDGDPLVLADAAVVVGFEIGQLRVFIQGVGLQIQAGGIGVGSANVGAFGKGLSADDGQHDALAPVVHIDLPAGLQSHSGLVGHEAPGLGQGHGVIHAVPLGLAVVQEAAVVGAVGLQRLLFSGRQTVPAVLGLIEKFVAQFAHRFGSSLQNSLKDGGTVGGKRFCAAKIVFYGHAAGGGEDVVGFLRPDPQLGIVPADALPGHKSGHPGVLRGGNGYGDRTQGTQAAFQQADGVNGAGLGGAAVDFLLHGPADMGPDDGVEPVQSLGIGKNLLPQPLALELPVLHHAGKCGIQIPEHGLVGFQKMMIDRVAVDDMNAHAGEDMQSCGLPTPGPPGDTDNGLHTRFPLSPSCHLRRGARGGSSDFDHMKSRRFFQAVPHSQTQTAAVGTLGPDFRYVGLIEGPEGVKDVAGLLGLVQGVSQVMDDMPVKEPGEFVETDHAGARGQMVLDVGRALDRITGDHGDGGLGGVMAVFHAGGLGPLAVGQLGDHGLVHRHLAQNLLQGFQGQAAGPQEPGRGAGQVNDGALHTHAAGAAIHDAVDFAPHILDHVAGGGGTGPPGGVAGWGGDGDPGPADDLQGHGVIGTADAHGGQAAGGPQGDNFLLGQDHGQRSWPKGPGQGIGRRRNVPAVPGQPALIGNMNNQRIVLGPALGFIDLPAGGFIESVGSQAIDRLRGDAQKSAGSDDLRGGVIFRIGQRRGK